MYLRKKKKKLSVSNPSGVVSSGVFTPSANRRRRKSSFVESEDEFVSRLGDFQLMEPIGKGGFGTVYRGLNVITGETVAVKRVSLMGVAEDEFRSIEMEIKLLQNLSHPNIVEYIDAICTEQCLYIFLEFVENGALSALMSKFGGKFPESLVAHYTTQVLEGLLYLHTQGVIHRDIKGSNILTTKAGTVKLADFGVATKLNESRKSNSVVGTPYWMAPEIIQMTGQQSSACDIWSVGCTVVELLTGKPPYFDIQQMPALFRIVQDDHPPLPADISPALEDFLLQCFQKDPQRRIRSDPLLQHPWLRKEKRSYVDGAVAGATTTAGLTIPGGPPSPRWAGDVEREGEFNHLLSALPENNQTSAESSTSLRLPVSLSSLSSIVALTSSALYEDNSVAYVSPLSAVPEDQETAIDASGPVSGNSSKSSSVHVSGTRTTSQTTIDPSSVLASIRREKLTVHALSEEYHDDDDDDTEVEGEDRDGVQERLYENEGVLYGTLSKASRWEALLEKYKETEEDAIYDPDYDPAAPFMASNYSSYHSLSPSPSPSPRIILTKAGSVQDGKESPAFFSPSPVSTASEPPSPSANTTTTTNSAIGSTSISSAGSTRSSTSSHSSQLDLEYFHRRKNTAWDLNKGQGGDEDACVFQDMEFPEDPGQTDMSLNEQTKIREQCLRLIGNLTPQTSADIILEACLDLTQLARKHPETVGALLATNAAVPVMELLEVHSSPLVIESVLRLVNKMIVLDTAFLQSVSWVGVVPAIVKFACPDYSSVIRLEAAAFIRRFCYASDFTRRLFIACGGLRVLVSSLTYDDDYDAARSLIWNAVDCILRVFSDASVNPRNDFHRLFCKYGLLRPLARALLEIVSRFEGEQQQEEALEYSVKMARILLLFSQGDAIVRHHFAQPEVLEDLFKVLRLLAPATFLPSTGTAPNSTTATATAAGGVDNSIVGSFSSISPLPSSPSHVFDLDQPGTPPRPDDVDDQLGDSEEVRLVSNPFLSSRSPSSSLPAADDAAGTLTFASAQAIDALSDSMAAVAVATAHHLNNNNNSNDINHNPPCYPLLLALLKSIHNLVMDDTTLDQLENAEAISSLMPFLQSPFREIHNQVITIFFYLLQLQPNRQEQAAVGGIIPHLQRFIRENNSLKQFALPIFLQLAKTSARTRLELKKHSGVDFYLSLLTESYWVPNVLEVLAFWLHEVDDNKRVEFLLCSPAGKKKLLLVFKNTQQEDQFENMLPLFQRLITGSVRLNIAFGRSRTFLSQLPLRLEMMISNNVRINLLKLINSLCHGQHLGMKAGSKLAPPLLQAPELLAVLTKLASATSSVIVASLATNLLTLAGAIALPTPSLSSVSSPLASSPLASTPLASVREDGAGGCE